MKTVLCNRCWTYHTFVRSKYGLCPECADAIVLADYNGHYRAKRGEQK